MSISKFACVVLLASGAAIAFAGCGSSKCSDTGTCASSATGGGTGSGGSAGAGAGGASGGTAGATGSVPAYQSCTASTDCKSGYACVSNGIEKDCEKLCTSTANCDRPSIAVCADQYHPGVKTCTAGCALMDPGAVCGAGRACYFDPSEDTTICSDAGSGVAGTSCAHSRQCGAGYACIGNGPCGDGGSDCCERVCRLNTNDCGGTACMAIPKTPVVVDNVSYGYCP